MTERIGESAKSPSATRLIVIDRAQHIFTANGLDDIVRRCPQQLGDDGKLIDVVFAGKQRFAFEHLGEDTPGAPNVNLDIVFLPCKHNLRRAIVSGGDISRHLRILNPSQAKVTDLQVAVFIDQDIAGLQIAVDDTCGMNVFETSLRL